MKTLLGILLYRPGYNTALAQLAKANPGLEADLVLTNDTGKKLDISEPLLNAWGSVTVLDEPADIFQHTRLPISKEKWKGLCFKRIASWQNALLLYAREKGYDTLIIWEDDQVFYHDGNEERAFFSPQIDTLANNEDVDVCVSKRRGYLHRVPPFIVKHIPVSVLKILEKSLCLCNEIVYTGLLTKPGGGFIPYGEPSPYGGVEYFGGLPFIYAGSLAINLHSSFPCFYDIPDLPGCRFSRGNDTFFSLGFDGGMKAKEVESTYFHDPYMVTTISDDPCVCFEKPMDCGMVANFMNLIKGWLSYSCLLLRLTFPYDWKSRINEIDSILKHLPWDFESIYQVFKAYAQRISYDYTAHQTTLDTWRRALAHLRQGSVHIEGRQIQVGDGQKERGKPVNLMEFPWVSP